MPFDFTIAIAKLDLTSYADRPDLDGLRARYPDLGFVFDRLEDLQETADTVDKQIEEAVDYEVNPLNEQIVGLEGRNGDLRFALNQIREMTVDAEITQIIEDTL